MTSREPDEHFLSVALQLAQEAARVVIDLNDQPLNEKRKEDRTLVTFADLRSDKIIREGLAVAFPEHGIVTEETGCIGSMGSEYVWLIDPLDGTKAYAKGIPGFAVMVGLLKQGEPYLGVVVDPLEGHTYEAIRGKGAFYTLKDTRRPLRVSDRDRLEQMRVVISTGFPEERVQRLDESLTGPRVNPINSVGIKVGLVVRQEADIYINHHSVHHWDTCAPQVILEEAGGTFTRLDGEPLRYDLEPPFSHDSLTLASNGTRHAELVTLLSQVFS